MLIVDTVTTFVAMYAFGSSNSESRYYTFEIVAAFKALFFYFKGTVARD